MPYLSLHPRTFVLGFLCGMVFMVFLTSNRYFFNQLKGSTYCDHQATDVSFRSYSISVGVPEGKLHRNKPTPHASVVVNDNHYQQQVDGKKPNANVRVVANDKHDSQQVDALHQGCKFPASFGGWHSGTFLTEIPPPVVDGVTGSLTWRQCARECAKIPECKWWTLSLQPGSACKIMSAKDTYYETGIHVESEQDLDCLDPDATVELVLSNTSIRTAASALAAVTASSTSSTSNDVNKNDCAAISVVTPLTADRLGFVQRILHSIDNNTRHPCEIILAVSSCIASSEDEATNDDSNNTSSPYQLSSFLPLARSIFAIAPTNLLDRLVILPTSESQNAAQNRNRAISGSSMPVVVNLDVDDVASPIWITTLEWLYYNISSIKNHQTTTSTPATGRTASLQQQRYVIPPFDFVVHPYYWVKHGVPVSVSSFDALADLQQQLYLLLNNKNDTTASANNLFIFLNELVPPGLLLLPITRQKEIEMFDWSNDLSGHPPYHNAHISFWRHLFVGTSDHQGIKQRPGSMYNRAEDSWFVCDLLQDGYQGLFFNRPLTGYEQTPQEDAIIDVTDFTPYREKRASLEIHKNKTRIH